MKLLEKGTRVRLTTPTLFGWKGTGTVVRDSGDTLELLRDDRLPPAENAWNGKVFCTRREVSVLRDQSLPAGWEQYLSEAEGEGK